MSKVAWRLAVPGLAFPEGLRWHGGHLYFSDVFGRTVHRVDGMDRVEVIGHVPACPSGLGFLPDGRLLAVAMRDRAVVDVPAGGTVVADLGEFVDADCNDMLVDPVGRAYVGNLGYDYVAGDEARPADLVMVDVDGSVRVVAHELWFPNGMVLLDGGRTLVVAETSAERLSAFTVAGDGSLNGRRVFAAADDFRPDGIAADAGGGIWAASPRTQSVVRVGPTGRLTHRLAGPSHGMPHACAIGGADGRSLFVACSPTHDEAVAIRERRGAIVELRIDEHL